MFTRQRRRSQTRKPSFLRRSSTHRSLGARSDWTSTPASEVGENGENGFDEDDPAQQENKRRWTIFDDEARQRNADQQPDSGVLDSPDTHVEKYVMDQLKRVMSPDDPALYEDEIEAR